MSTIGTTLFSKIEINGQEVDIATLDANDGIYALPAGYTTANVKFTMIDNTSIPRGVFEENSYITTMTLPDAMTYIASYSFHGVNNINTTDRNAILAINPYAFDAEPEPTPTPPTPDPDFYFNNSNYEIIVEREENMKYKLTNNTQIDTNVHKIQWSSSSADITIGKTNGRLRSYVVGATGTITATLSDGTNTHTATCTVSIVADKGNPTGQWYNQGNPVTDLHVVLGGSSTYTLTFSGTPSDSWTLQDPMVSGISVDTTTGTVTITESNLDSIGGVTINASRPADTSYYEGLAQLYIIVESGTRPDIYFMNPSLTIDYNMEPNKLNGTEITQALSGNDAYSGAWIVWSTDNSSIATVNHGGYVVANGNGTVNIIAEYTAHDNYASKTVQYQLTITNYNIKQNPTANWVDSNLNPVYNLQLVEGNTSDQTLTFSATPNDSWSLYDPGMPGVSVNTTTGEITITGASVQSSEGSISASRMEDASYYSGFASLSIKVFPAGTDLTFYYEQLSVNLDNQAMTQVSPMLHDEYVGLGYTNTYTSADTNVATVDAYGMISFVGAGTTTVTATTTNGTDTHTATITVYCTVMKQYSHATWIDPSTQMTSTMITCANGTTIDFNGTPLSGWTFTPSDPAIIINAGNQVVVDSGTSGQTYTVSASYTEDATYYAGSGTLTITIS